VCSPLDLRKDNNMSSGISYSTSDDKPSRVNLEVEHSDYGTQVTENESFDIVDIVKSVPGELRENDINLDILSSSCGNDDVTAGYGSDRGDFDEVDRGMPAGWLVDEEARSSKPKVSKREYSVSVIDLQYLADHQACRLLTYSTWLITKHVCGPAAHQVFVIAVVQHYLTLSLLLHPLSSLTINVLLSTASCST